jgi:hypothetical protein
MIANGNGSDLAMTKFDYREASQSSPPITMAISGIHLDFSNYFENVDFHGAVAACHPIALNSEDASMEVT